MKLTNLFLIALTIATGVRGAEINVNAKATSLRLEHTCQAAPPPRDWLAQVRAEPALAFRYIVRYADGTELPVLVRWGEGVEAAQRPPWIGPLAWAEPTTAGRYVMTWPNPFPDKVITSVQSEGETASVTPVTEQRTGQNYYVAPTGDDNGPGGFEKPWATPHKAAATAQAGDTVYFRGGTYAVTKPVMPAHSGKDEAWITFCNYPGESAIFNGQALTSDRTKLELVVEWDGKPAATISTRTGVWHILGRSYIRLLGLAVQDAGFAGIGVDALPWWPVDGIQQPEIPASHHIEILHNRVQRTSCVGIGVYGSIIPAYRTIEYVKVVGNLILHADDKEVILSGTDPARSKLREELRRHGRGKGGDENLDFHAVQHLEVAHNEVGHGGKEGIDLMNGTRHATVHHNYVHDQFHGNFSGSPCGIYLDCRSEQWDIEISHNVSERNGQGIQANSEDDAPFHNIRIHHNICKDNYWAGINVSLWRDTSKPIHDILIEKNIVFRNGFLESNKPPGGGIWIGTRTLNMRDVTVRDNIAVGNRDYQIARGLADPVAAKIKIDRNQIWPVELKKFENPDWAKRWVPTHGTNPILAEPRFVDPDNYNFDRK